MDNREVMLHEYNNLWNEKLIHKQSIRKFHNYLTYITAIGSIAMAFYGVSAQDFFKAGLNPSAASDVLRNATNIVHLFFIAFTPVVIITLTFPLNDIYHTYVMAHQLGQLEKRINYLSDGENLLSWENAVCPIVYGGRKVIIGGKETKLTNIIARGDFILLIPAIATLCIFATIVSLVYICKEVGFFWTVAYALGISYMLGAIAWLGLRVKNYTKASGPIAAAVQPRAGEAAIAEER
jgi:hypothetical protein